jgi:hypothetical protein
MGTPEGPRGGGRCLLPKYVVVWWLAEEVGMVFPEAAVEEVEAEVDELERNSP